MDILNRLKRNLYIGTVIAIIAAGAVSFQYYQIYRLFAKNDLQVPFGDTAVTAVVVICALLYLILGWWNCKRANREFESLSAAELEEYNRQFATHEKIGHFYCAKETFLYYRRGKIRIFRYDEIRDLELHRTIQRVNFIPVFFYYDLYITLSSTGKRISVSVRRIHAKRDYELLIQKVNQMDHRQMETPQFAAKIV